MPLQRGKPIAGHTPWGRRIVKEIRSLLVASQFVVIEPYASHLVEEGHILRQVRDVFAVESTRESSRGALDDVFEVTGN